MFRTLLSAFMVLGLLSMSPAPLAKPVCKTPKKLHRGKCVYASKIRTPKRPPKRAAPTGQRGGRCYANLTCNEGLTCLKRRCRLPGALGEPCRKDKTCTNDLGCVKNPCLRVGALDEPCRGGKTCNKGMLCKRKRCRTIPVGYAGGSCFPNDTCNKGLSCWHKRCWTPNRLAEEQEAAARKAEAARRARTKAQNAAHASLVRALGSFSFRVGNPVGATYSVSMRSLGNPCNVELIARRKHSSREGSPQGGQERRQLPRCQAPETPNRDRRRASRGRKVPPAYTSTAALDLTRGSWRATAQGPLLFAGDWLVAVSLTVAPARRFVKIMGQDQYSAPTRVILPAASKRSRSLAINAFNALFEACRRR